MLLIHIFFMFFPLDQNCEATSSGLVSYDEGILYLFMHRPEIIKRRKNHAGNFSLPKSSVEGYGFHTCTKGCE